MKNKYIFLVILFILTSTNVNGQKTDYLNKPKHQRVSQAYGFIIGQEYTLNIIKSEFPKFEIHVLKAEMAFNSTFGNSKVKLKDYLLDFLGQNEFLKFEGTLQNELNKTFENQIISEEAANGFIIEVESRAKGNIISPVLETLLCFQFYDFPADEFRSGFTSIFKTKGHPKSKNTDWQLRVPISWKAEEAERPNIIQKFTSDYGSGHQAIMLMVKDLDIPKEYKATKEELNNLFTEKEMKVIMVPDGAKFISFSKMTIDRNIGGMIEFEQIVERLDFKLKVRMVIFMFIRGNKMYSFQGNISTSNINTDLSVDMKKYLPLYKLVANSIVVNEQYK